MYVYYHYARELNEEKYKNKDELKKELHLLQLCVPVAQLDKCRFSKISRILELKQEVQKTFDLTLFEDAEIYKQSSKCLPPRSHTVSDNRFLFDKSQAKNEEKGEPSACLNTKAKATSEEVVKLSRTKELKKDETLFRGQHNVNDQLVSSCNETARTIKDDTTQEDKTKNSSLVKKASETNQDKSSHHSITSKCELFETSSDEKHGNKIPSEEYRSVYDVFGIPVVYTSDVQIEKKLSVICEPVNDVVILHPDKSEDVELAKKILEHLMTIVPGLKGELQNDVFLPGQRIFQVDHLFESLYIFILITPFYSLPESAKLHHQVDMMLHDSLNYVGKKGRIIPVLVEKNIDLPKEFASIKPLKFYLTYAEEQIDKSPYFSKINKLFRTKLNRANSCTS
ncbi:unnamed protein product [Mytilus coruscus]|uniref:TIR domain-containing protein n=1 Tax=Mytilus coruscus TaxID=42192 RepID=A0A6J8DWX9_MYTCO|nr:unnamed protein product [Mytilus coruscus]